MSVRWGLPSFLAVISCLMLALPAEAARLLSWQFNERQNQLAFTTDEAVQPQAMLLSNPTRVVIDLPGTTLSQAQVSRPGGAIREIRAGQFTPDMARIVIELSPGYTINPQQVEVRGQTNSQWVVQLPEPQPTAGTTAVVTPNQVTAQPDINAPTQVVGIVATPDGFFIRTRGAVPRITTEQVGEREEGNRQLIIELADTSVSHRLNPNALPSGRYSITSWQVNGLQGTPPRTQVVMNLGDASPEWNAVSSNLGGVVVLPTGGVSISQVPDRPTSPTTAATPTVTQPSQPASSRPPTNPTTPSSPTSPLTTAQPRQGNERIVVVIDPGHGGQDPGAVGIGGLQEKQVIFPISLQVAQILQQAGLQVVMTRQDDRTLDLEPRVQIAERADADVFVSIHANAISMSRPDVNGIESYYASASGQRLAQILQTTMLRATGMRDRGVKQARFYVLVHTSMPAALVEVGFVTGAEDAPRLADPAWRDTMARAIASGILEYVQQTY